MKKSKIIIWPLILVFIILNAVWVTQRRWFQKYDIDADVLIVTSLLLFLLASAAVYMHKKAIANPNPNAFVRSVLSAMILKIFVLAAAAFIYIAVSKEKRSDNALFVGMGLYFIYSFIEVRLALSLNKKK